MANPTQIAKRHPSKEPPPRKRHPAKKDVPAVEPKPEQHEQFHHFHGPLPPGSDESDDLTS